MDAMQVQEGQGDTIEPLLKVCLCCRKCERKMNKCVTCKKLGFKKYYCSKDCQSKDWPKHKILHKTLLQNEGSDEPVKALSLDDGTQAGSRAKHDVNGMTELMARCFEGNVRQVRRILSTTTDWSIFESDKQGLSALMYAIVRRQPEIVELLLNAGASDPNLLDNLMYSGFADGYSYLYVACMGEENVEIVKLLAKVGGRRLVHKASNDGTCLHQACQNGHVNIVRELLRVGGNDLALKATSDGISPLHVACMHGHRDIVAVLIRAGGDALLRFGTTERCVLGHGRTSLFIACKNGHFEVVKALIDAGGPSLIVATGRDEQTCLYAACSGKHTRVIKELIKGMGSDAAEYVLRAAAVEGAEGVTPFILACQNGHKEAVRAMLEVGGERLVRKTSRSGLSCLYAACALGHAGVARELLAAPGVSSLLDVVRPAPCSLTCLGAASLEGHADVIPLLLEAGGRRLLTWHCDDGSSCLHLACSQGHVAAAAELVRAGGAELMLRHKVNGFTALHSASAAGQLDIVAALVGPGSAAPPDARRAALLRGMPEDGATALYVACEHGRAAVVRLLVELGGDELVHAVVSNGGSCLLVASQAGHLEVVRDLISAGGRALLRRVRTDDGASCLYMACMHGHAEVARALVRAGAAGKWLVRKPRVSGDTPLCAAIGSGSRETVGVMCEALGRDLAEVWPAGAAEPSAQC